MWAFNLQKLKEINYFSELTCAQEKKHYYSKLKVPHKWSLYNGEICKTLIAYKEKLK